jgi:hypothetical protein
MNRFFLLLSIFLIISSGSSFAQESEKSVIITLENGNTKKGNIQRKNDNSIFLIDQYGDEHKIDKSEIVEIKVLHENSQNQIKSDLKETKKNTKKEDKTFGSFGLGYGNSYGGLGIKYQYNFGPLGLHGGLGYFPASLFLDYDFVDNPLLIGVGMKIYLNKDRSLYLNPQYGSFGVKAIKQEYYTQDYESSSTYQNVMHGPSLLIGVDAYFSDSFGLNGGIGVSYNTVEDEWDDMFDRSVKYWLSVDLGLLFK